MRSILVAGLGLHEIEGNSYPTVQNAPLVLMLNFSTKRCVLTMGGYGGRRATRQLVLHIVNFCPDTKTPAANTPVAESRVSLLLGSGTHC